MIKKNDLYKQLIYSIIKDMIKIENSSENNIKIKKIKNKD
jgi:hypothetical protein